jgi:hypothetical protein
MGVTMQRGRFPLVPSRYFPYRRISAKFLKSRMCVSNILSLPLSSETAPTLTRAEVSTWT